MPVNARANVNITIYEGATFSQTFQWKTGDPATPVNITGFTGIMHVRASIDSETILIDLNTAGGGIVIEPPPTDGKYTIFIPAEDTAGLCADHELIVAVYDLFLISGDVYMMQQYGNALIYPAVTRE